MESASCSFLRLHIFYPVLVVQGNHKQYSFDGMLCARSLSLNVLSFILVPAEQLGLLLTKLDCHFPLLEAWEKLLSSQQCCSLLLSTLLDPYLPSQAASLVPANNLGTCSSARVANVVDLSQIYGAFKLLDISFSQPSSLGSAGLWETEKRVVVQVCCR